MNIAISGTPGVGKTTIAKLLGKKLNLKVINEKDFALKKGIGSFNEMDELEIPIDEFEKTANALLLKEGNIIFEGHLLCEMKLKVDKFIVLTLDPEKLQLRLELRNYSAEKVQANVEVEMLGGPWGELLDDIRPVFEGIDGVQEWIKAGCPQHTTPELAIDWLSQP